MTDYNDEDAKQAADFDAFFREEVDTGERERQPLTVCGRRYLLPDSLPLMFTVGMERLQSSTDINDVRKMLSPLFGRSALDDWAEDGMTDRQFRIVLVYAAANVRSPGSLTMAGAAELHDKQEAEKAAAGKAPAPNRAARRKKSGKRGSSGKR
ncbi:hypothetical protein [Streptomyces olivaceus]|uniref:hypothetical protein n=1 Tax=Streptomyces olivaceus TaxID=47716 RepID=UPI001CCE7C56|nr:hypothetical protein [Streptomyces olivaceus]